jgi:PAS domain S-box-containing protein
MVADVMVRKQPDFDSLRKLPCDSGGRIPIITYAATEEDLNAPESGDSEPILRFSESQIVALVRAHLQVARMRRESLHHFRSTEDRFRTLKTMLTQGVWVAAPNGAIIDECAWWWEEFTGQTPEQYRGFGWLDALHPEDKLRVTERWQAALQSATAYQIECRVRRRDGSYGHVRSQGAPVRDGDGNVRGWIGTLIDIDQGVEAERELRDSEERYRTFMAMTTLAVWRAGPQGEANSDLHDWSEVTGQTPEQYQGMGWLDAVHPDDKLRMQEIWKSALRNATSIDTEFRLRRKDGTYGYVRSRGVPLRNSDGTVREWIGALIDIDERKRVEDALRESEERYRTLTTSTTEAVWSAKPDGEIIGDCPGWENMTSQTPQQYRGWGWMNVVHPDDKQQILEKWNNALQNAVPADLTYRTRRRDGSYGYVRAQAAPMVNPDGSVREWIGTIVDIDDQKRAEEGLRRSEEEFRVNFEMAGIGQLQTDPKTGRFVRVNNRFCEMVGYSADELLTMTHLDITHPEDCAGSMNNLLDLLRGHTSEFTMERRYVRKDGSILFSLVTSTLIHDAQRRPLRTITMIEDITERKQAEALSQCQKKALEMVAEGASLREVLDSVIVAVEKQATVDLRASIQILEDDGKRFRFCCAPSFPESYRQAVALSRVDRHDAPCTLALFLREPVIIPDLMEAPEWAEVAKFFAPYAIRSIWTAPIISSDRKPLGTFCFYSSRARTPSAAQQSIMESVIQTIALAIERKETEAQREQLLIREQAAREQAETASRMKDEFLAVVSHELRAPLNAISGWAYMLMTGRLDEVSKVRALQSIQRQVHSQTELIDDLLDIARIVSGKLRLELTDVDVSKVINDALDVVRPAAEAKNIDLVAELDSSIGMMRADPERLQQVIWNLLSNAVKFTPDRGRVEMRSGRTDSIIEITVSDTGKGISADFLPYVFERFRQADASTTRTHGGIGLGLAIVRHLIELHGGTVCATSPGEGKGATFTIRAPICPVRTTSFEIADRNEKSEALMTPGGIKGMLDGLRVQVVEDNSEDREVLFAELAYQGATVSASADAAEALRELDQFHPDVLVADIAMPGEDGYSLIRKIRARPFDQGGQTPAIALTGLAGVTEQQRALYAGFQEHMTKPADPNKLARAIVHLAANSVARRTAS